MKFYSLKNPGFRVSYREAVLMGQAPEKGLFFPEFIPRHSKEFLAGWKKLTNEEIALEAIAPFTGDEIEMPALRKIIEETINFDFPLKKVEEHIYALELYHGPTLAFKDVGARFLSRCLEYFVSRSDKKVTILVATSGDTGGAVADAFYGVQGVDVIILFPSGKVSEVQRLQLTTYGGNIRACEVSGSFDDCQAMVKQAFADKELNDKYLFNSANSINIARWLAQQFYYYFALKQWPGDTPPVISVPSGNFGNICAGLLAYRRGLPVTGFVAANNENDLFVRYLTAGDYEELETIPTVSNAMDVGKPSNFQRVLELFGNDLRELRKHISAYRFTSDETMKAIQQTAQSTGYIMDPHGAVGYLALKEHLKQSGVQGGIFLETAHPAKFKETVQPLVNSEIAIPQNIQKLSEKKSESMRISTSFEEFKEMLLSQ
ncbi:MAG: threonine synthase [Chitinophagaceae bacterium]|nr:threonine synthase [Chitinophagaceae bacterium]